MLNVLMIEDDPDLADTVKELAEERLSPVEFSIEKDFNRAIDSLSRTKPDVVILDLALDESHRTQFPGSGIWEEVWARRFCPIVVYTARAESVEDQLPSDHPFVRLVAKGPDTDEEVIGIVGGFSSHVQGIHAVEDRILQTLQQVLKDVSVHVFAGETDEDVRRDMLMRAARRRIAAVLDHDVIAEDRQLANWEKYIIPPLEPDLMMADLIRERAKPPTDPTAYRVIITPTCDMVRSQGPKVHSALVAGCCDWKVFFTKGANLAPNTGASKLKGKLPALLNECYADGYLLLPEYPKVFPSMTVNLRDLALVALENIGDPADEDKGFERVASIDSPFREQVAWNYLQVTGRPGAPPCDNQGWVEMVVQAWGKS